MASKKGTLLERNVYRILKSSGFEPELNKIYEGYEIDVFLSHGNSKIAFECKQYEKGSLVVRNLIHQWRSKKQELKFDRLVLVLVGADISNKDLQLAEKYNILIWDENKFNSLFDGAVIKRGKKIDKMNTILKQLGIGEEATIPAERTSSRKQMTVEEKLDYFDKELKLKNQQLKKAILDDDENEIRNIEREIREIKKKKKYYFHLPNRNLLNRLKRVALLQQQLMEQLLPKRLIF